MNPEPRKVLTRLYAEHGSAILADPSRCRAFLSDLCGEHEREIFLLIRAQQDNVPETLLHSQGDMPWEVTRKRLIKRLQKDRLLTENAAIWAVDSWSLILGLIDEKEIEEIDLHEESSPILDEEEGLEELFVSPYGDGTHTVIAKAVEDAAVGATIHLVSGQHNLKEPLFFEKSIILIGEGKDETILNIHADIGIGWNSTGTLDVIDLGFVCKGNVPAVCVAVGGTGKVSFLRCGFRGASSSGEVDGLSGGIGLLFLDEVQGKVTDCETADNSVAGILISETAKGTLEGNKCHGSRVGIAVSEHASAILNSNECLKNLRGIAVSGESKVKAEKNICRENKEVGIWVTDKAVPDLEGNQCLQNKTGILFQGSSGGEAKANTCMNGEIGIAAIERSFPSLHDNQCIQNIVGISFEGESRGLAWENVCQKNDVGIIVIHQSLPSLINNKCVQNENAGISYRNSSRGEAKENLCSENENGIWVSDSAEPLLERNSCKENKRNGIDVDQRAQTTVVSNTCSRNQGYGIVFMDKSRGEVRGNTFAENGKGGVWVDEKSELLIEKNECRDNRGNGISVSSGRKVVIRQNRCYANKGFGISTTSFRAGLASRKYLKSNDFRDNEKGDVL